MSKKRQRELVQACLLGDVAAVGKLLHGLDPDALTIENGTHTDTLLTFAIRRNNLPLVKTLVERGASLDRANGDGETPLAMIASSTDRALRGYFDIRGTHLPIDLGVRFFDVIDRVVAAPTGGEEAARLRSLLALVDPTVTRQGETALHVLARGRVAEVALYETLLEAGVPADAVDPAGATALHHCCEHGLDSVAVLLLDAGAPVDAVDRGGRTPLHRAARSPRPGVEAIVRELLARGASPIAVDGDGLRAADGARPQAAAILAETPGASLRGDLERELRASFTRDNLAIYADALLQEDDPRGELITLDLDPKPSSGKWRERRHALHEAWIGPHADLHAFERLTRFGFVPHVDDIAGAQTGRRTGRSRIAAALMATPAAHYVRSFAVWGASERVFAALWNLSEARRPWLSELLIAPNDRKVDRKLVESIIAAMPYLDAFYVLNSDVMAQFPHPKLARCFVTSPRTIFAGSPRHTTIMKTEGTKIPADVVHLALEAIDTLGDAATRDRVIAEYGDTIPELAGVLDAFERDGATRFDEARATGPLTAFGRALLTKNLRSPLCF